MYCKLKSNTNDFLVRSLRVEKKTYLEVHIKIYKLKYYLLTNFLKQLVLLLPRIATNFIKNSLKTIQLLEDLGTPLHIDDQNNNQRIVFISVPCVSEKVINYL